jgi:tRNA uridine 5-carbamoylmethylation protein Kti12
MKTNALMEECYQRFVTPESKEQVEQTCKMMDDCEEIINNEYADVEIHKPSFYEGFKSGVTYFVNSGIDAPNIPIYIVRLCNFIIDTCFIQFVSISKAKAIIYYQEQDHSNPDVHWVIEEWIGEKCKIIKTEIK